MAKLITAGVIETSLKRVRVTGGDVLHALKMTDDGFDGFGEAYFSMIEQGEIKGWKYHKRMTMNLIVPLGSVKFVFFDEKNSSNNGFSETIIGLNNYSRITVSPKIWFAFQGYSSPLSMVLNIANIVHDPMESERLSINELPYDWKNK